MACKDMGKDSLARRERTRPYERQRRSYAKNAPEYDREADLIERWIFGTKHRGWACSQAVGETLEVAIGTGLNLTHYPADVRLIGIDLSPEMLAFAEARARNIGCPVGLIEGAAQVLPLQTVPSTRSCARMRCVACPMTPKPSAR